MPPPRAEPAAGQPDARAPARTLPEAQAPPTAGALLTPADLVRRIETLERLVANLETAYNELRAALSSRGGNQQAAPDLAQRYEQNLRNLLPSHRRSREAAEASTAAEPPTTRQRMQ